MKANKLTTEDLQAISELLDKQTAVLATKEELNDLRIELKDYMSQGFEAVMGGMDEFLSKTIT